MPLNPHCCYARVPLGQALRWGTTCGGAGGTGKEAEPLTQEGPPQPAHATLLQPVAPAPETKTRTI